MPVLTAICTSASPSSSRILPLSGGFCPTVRRNMDFFASSSFAKSIDGLELHFNVDGWGPVNGEKVSTFDEVPYAHFDKKDKCYRVADFSQNSYGQQYQRPFPRYRRDEMGNVDFSYKHDAVEDSTFQLVDTSKTQAKTTKRFGPQGRGRDGRGFGRGMQGGRGGRGAPTQQEPQFSFGGKRAKTQPGRGGAGRGGRMGGRGNFRRDRKMDRVPSLAVGGEWAMVEEFDLPALLKLVANPPLVEDLVWTGHLDQYDEAYDKLTSRTAKLLKRIENKVFYAVRTADDPILEKFAVEEIGNVYATDAILALLMASPRSVYSWDITIEKTNGILFLDKRENSLFDFLTVSETAREPPQASEDIEEINHPEKLSIEATMINQNFSQQVLKENDPASRKTFEPNPFFEDDNSGGEPASVAYRYRKFTLGGINVVARCELHGWTSKRGEEQNITVYSLNEWDSKYADGVNWRQKIDTQRGAVLATELKNNSCKLAKWTAQSILAGADQMKLGYVTRVANTNAYEHTILATQFFKPKELAAQINLSVNNMWGIVKMLCELVLNKADGKYVLLKDPNKPTVRLYSVPLTFDEDEEEEGDADDEEQEEEDDDDA